MPKEPWILTDERIKAQILSDDTADIFKPLTLGKSIAKEQARHIAERLDKVRKSGKSRGECIGNLDKAVDELIKEIRAS